MTAEEFQREYLIGDPITEGAVVSCRAKDLLGSAVLVHYLVGDEARSRSSLLDYLPRLNTAHAERIRILAEVDGIPVLVTDLLEGFTSLADWLENAVSGEAVAHGPAEPRSEAMHRANPSDDASLLETSVMDAEEVKRISGQPAHPNPPPKKTGKPSAFTMVFGERHDPPVSSPPDTAALAETRVTPTSGSRVAFQPPAPETDPAPAAAVSSRPGADLSTSPPAPTPPLTAPPPNPGMSTRTIWLLLILALIIGGVLGVALLG
jgi:hypothetical protein